MDYRNEILSLANRVAECSGLALATIAHKAAKDGDFFKRLEAGGSCTVDTYLTAKRWLESQLKEGGEKNQ